MPSLMGQFLTRSRKVGGRPVTFDVFWGVLLIGVAAYAVRRYRNRPALSSKSWRRARLLSLAFDAAENDT